MITGEQIHEGSKRVAGRGADGFDGGLWAIRRRGGLRRNSQDGGHGGGDGPPYPAYPPYPVDPSVRTGEPARYPDAKPNPVKRTAEQPVSTFAIDVDTASYAVVRRFLASGAKPPVDAVRVEELINYFPYDYPRPAREEVFKPFVAVAPSPWAPGKRLMHVALTGYDIPRSERPPLNLVFLVDVSGSMEGEDRLPLAKKALGVLVDQLRPQDRVAMVVYAGQSGEVLEPTSGRNKAKIMRAIRELGAGGPTAGAEGLEHAYQLARENFDEDAVNRVILMTDGDFNVGVISEDQLEDMVADQRQTGIYLSVYGFGQDNHQDRRMQAISQAGNGTAGYIDTLDEARKVFRDDFTSSVFPIADDVKIQVEFNPAAVAEWRLLGYETRLLARQDFNNDRVDAGRSEPAQRSRPYMRSPLRAGRSRWTRCVTVASPGPSWRPAGRAGMRSPWCATASNGRAGRRRRCANARSPSRTPTPPWTPRRSPPGGRWRWPATASGFATTPTWVPASGGTAWSDWPKARGVTTLGGSAPSSCGWCARPGTPSRRSGPVRRPSFPRRSGR